MREKASLVWVGPYQILSEIGRGGMGIVYRAYDAQNKRQVALKVLLPELSRKQAIVHRFWNEYQSLRGLRHPNIVQVYDFNQDKGLYYIAVEYVQGGSLANRLAARWQPNTRTARHIVRQVAAALDSAHLRNIVHCDLKPANILLDRRGRVVLTDFGIVHILRTCQQNPSGSGAGTPEYMAPEQIHQVRPGSDQQRQVVDHRADIYSLGLLTYRLLAGRLPFQHEVPAALLHAHVYETPPPLRAWQPNLSAEVERVVLWALAKSPKDRPRSAGEFVQYLEAAFQSSSRRWPWSSLQPTRKVVFAAVAVFTLLVSLVLIYIVSNSSASSVGELAYTCQNPAKDTVRLCLNMGRGQSQVFVFKDQDWSPSWAPDGKRLAFVTGNEQNWDIWLMDTGAGSALPLIEHDAHDTAPSWAPDGRSLAFDSDRSGNIDVFVYSLPDRQVSQLTSTPYLDSDPAWSPMGRQIAFVSRRDGDLEIYVMDANGENPKRLTRHIGRDFAPSWSPDGKRIVYECKVDNQIEICVMDADGQDKRQLTRGQVDNRQPSWSPDGKWIAFSRQRENSDQWDIWVMRPDGSEQQEWTRNDYSNTQPAWRP